MNAAEWAELSVAMQPQYGPGELSRYSVSLQAGRSENSIAVGAKFSAFVQNGAWARWASYIMCTGSFPGVKRPELGVDHQPPYSAEVKERVGIYLYYSSGPPWPVRG